MTDPAVLAGDGSTVDYCALPELDGSGLMAADIPKGNTPGCAYEHFPMPILADCTEPLVDGAQDIRGLWKAVSGKVGHIERVEQCGERTVITTSGIIHDLGPNSTGGITSNDTEGSVSFIMKDRSVLSWAAKNIACAPPPVPSGAMASWSSTPLALAPSLSAAIATAKI